MKALSGGNGIEHVAYRVIITGFVDMGYDEFLTTHSVTAQILIDYA